MTISLGGPSWYRCSLPRRLTAVDDERRAGHPGRRFRREKHECPLQIVGTAEAPKRNTVEQRLFVPLEQHTRHVGRQPTGSNAVDVYPVSRPLAREISREGDDGPFRRLIRDRVHHVRGPASEGCYRRDVDDLPSSALTDHLDRCRLTEEEHAREVHV